MSLGNQFSDSKGPPSLKRHSWRRRRSGSTTRSKYARWSVRDSVRDLPTRSRAPLSPQRKPGRDRRAAAETNPCDCSIFWTRRIRRPGGI